MTGVQIGGIRDGADWRWRERCGMKVWWWIQEIFVCGVGAASDGGFDV